MTAANIGKKRLESLLAFDEGFSARELSIAEREIKTVLARHFLLDGKDVEISFAKSEGEIVIRVLAKAKTLKKQRAV